MRWVDFLLGVSLWQVYLAAVWNTLLDPRQPQGTTWCHHPRRCPRRHRLVFIVPPGKPVRIGLKHLHGV